MRCWGAGKQGDGTTAETPIRVEFTELRAHPESYVDKWIETIGYFSYSADFLFPTPDSQQSRSNGLFFGSRRDRLVGQEFANVYLYAYSNGKTPKAKIIAQLIYDDIALLNDDGELGNYCLSDIAHVELMEEEDIKAMNEMLEKLEEQNKKTKGE